MIDKIPADDESYKELSDFVRFMESNYSEGYVYLITTQDTPFDVNAVKKLKKDGWQLELERFSLFDGCVDEIYKKFLMSEKLEGFKRDITLCHEAVHGFYGAISHDSWGARHYYNEQRRDTNKAITEWVARRFRANPKNLACILDCFSLPSQIYDWSSLSASEIRGETKISPNMRKKYRKVIME